MATLFIESSTPIGSAALYEQSSCMGFAKAQVPNSHMEILHQLIFEVCSPINHNWSQVHNWVMGAGPGSNTGLRIGLATLKGMVMVHAAPIVLIDSHAALAFQAGGGAEYRLVVTSSRPGLYNYTLFRNFQIERRGGTRNMDELSELLKSEEVLLVTSEAGLHTVLHHSFHAHLVPDANTLANYFLTCPEVLQVPEGQITGHL